MVWFGDDHKHTRAHNQYQGAPKNKAHLSHELLSGAAAYAAAKAYQNHVAAKGKPVSHAKAKSLAAGFAGAFIDKQFETHDLNFLDKEKAKHQGGCYLLSLK
ncbi:hypothetical protein BGY98DRAFT_919361 [Russula aff. rugulosa BPL654]|nr:hypothetical protein BGY98DRAFT_919361 [Russula aff. rugulosa BPL654]